MKYLLSSLLSLAISLTAFAQNSPGADYFALGEIKLAKEYFTKNIGQTPAESYYYLGEIAFLEGNMTEAKTNFEKGLAADPLSAFNAIGLAKLELKSNTKVAEDQLSEIFKKNKKDVSVILAIAKAYSDNGMTEKATAKVEDARKANKKSPYIYIFEGDLLAKAGKAGDAAMQYDQAINFDPNCVLAYVKGARVYESINPTTAIGMLKKVTAIRPDYKITYRYLGKLYYANGFYAEAIAAYKEYFSAGDYTVADIIDLAAAQYFSKNYGDAVTVINEGLGREADNFVLNRLLMYSDNELKEYDEGMAVGQKFFSIPRDTAKYIVQDYMTYGNILSEAGQKIDAIAQYKKAIELDPSKIELNKEIAIILANESMNAEAAEFYKKYIELMGEKAEASDFFQLGRYYYMAGTAASKDSTLTAQAPAMFKDADAAFAIVAERIPESHLGNLWRARTNASLDPETIQGLAKPYYDETVRIITAKNDGENTRELIEAYRYLAYYYYVQFDATGSAEAKANTKLNCEKLLELDPENSVGLQLLEVVK
ncbi:tetratricopeptide repeat protein [Dysgonomonas sp. ZJ279]|uniref:tetratricopeptide repeat protein n=1 Tax=Dysgonomonas sp. ZJ279 TaxID=2709796 RepID=UPI002102F47D|nr:hypothetical protein [Dysgonomonas sp. ZJ279]